MARYIRAVLLVALVLWTGEARGECAWVLWEEQEVALFPSGVVKVPPVVSWALYEARQTRGECQALLTKTWQMRLNNSQPGPERPLIKQVESAPAYVSTTLQDKDGRVVGWESYRFRCLPDTVDPRGPKGTK